MEEHQVPVHEEPVIVASSKKHSWSKKERLALYVTGVVALVGIGFGGYTFYDQVIANAAGESLLGDDVSVDLPQPNESPYFKVTGVGRENIAITPTGEASQQKVDRIDVQSGWRIEQSSDPANESSWIVVMDGTKSGYGITTNDCYNNMYWPKEQTIAPNTTYYFRATKLATDTNQWVPQDPVVNVTTAANPVLTASNTNGQITFNWTNDVAEPYSCKSSAYYIARATSADNLKSASDSTIDWRQDLSYSTSSSVVVRNISSNTTNEPLKAGTLTVAQPKNTSYFYSLLRYESRNSTPSYKSLGAEQMLTTKASTNVMGGTATLQNPKVAASNYSDAQVAITVSNSAALSWNFNSTATIKTWSPKTASKFGTDCTISYSSPYRTDKTQTQRTYDYCQNLVPGTYPVSSFVSAHPQGSNDATLTEATNTVSLTLDKVAPQMQINYLGAGPKFPPTKAGKNVTIAMYNNKVYGYSFLPEGQLIVKNVTTGKVLKTVTLGSNTSSINITLKKMKKGKYNLAVIYKASTNPGIFQDKTVTLPLLTVK
jgi:hypothetical protein